MEYGNDEQFREIVPGFFLGGISGLSAMLARKPDVLVPLNHLPGWVWNSGFRGEILYYPITDYYVLPDDVLDRLAEEVAVRLREGKKTAMFCLGGHGRTGYAAACILHLLGIEDPIAFLRTNYSPCAVETELQERRVEQFCLRHPL